MKKDLSSFLKNPVIEISLAGQDLHAKDKIAARAFLRSCRIPESGLVSSDYKGAFRICCFVSSSKKASEICKQYRNLQRRPLKLRVKKLKRGDWFDKWKQDYHIRPLGTKFMIVPLWEKKKFMPGRRMPVFLEPGSAFGSGYHETTRLMTRLLESLAGRMPSFLDLGCGTGILSVVASKLGAVKITGYDNDRPSAIVAGENFFLNGCEGGKFFFDQLKNSKVTDRFSVVGANLLSKTLLEHRNRILARVRPGGSLLVSGIALQNLASFKKGFDGAGLRCLKILRGRKWAALLYKKV